MVIVGTVLDEGMGDCLRVTMVATGLGGGVARRQVQPPVQQQAQAAAQAQSLTVVERTGTDGMGVEVPDYEGLARTPTVFRSGRANTIGTLAATPTNLDTLEIPAFLRKQAD